MNIFKTALHPTGEQKEEITKAMALCRLLYNDYLCHLKMTRFSREGLPSPQEYLREEISKEFSKKMYEIPPGLEESVLFSLSAARDNVLRALKEGHPLPKEKSQNAPVSLFFRGSLSEKEMPVSERHRVFLPHLGWIRLKEKGFIPLSNGGEGYVCEGFLSERGGRYFLSVLFARENRAPGVCRRGRGIWICPEIMAEIIDGKPVPISFTHPGERKIKRRLRRLRRSLSKSGSGKTGNRNGKKNKEAFERLLLRREAISKDAMDKALAGLLRDNPAYVTMASVPMQNNTSSASLHAGNQIPVINAPTLAGQRRLFQKKLIGKCRKMGIPVFIRDTDFYRNTDG